MITWEKIVMMMENTVKMTRTMILMKFDERVLRGRRVMIMSYRIVWGVVLSRVRVLGLLMSIY